MYWMYGMNMNMNINIKIEYEYGINVFFSYLHTTWENEVKWKSKMKGHLLTPLTILKPLTTNR